MFSRAKKEPSATAPPDLTAAITKASGILDQRSRNRAAARETEQLLKAAESFLATRRRELAETEANSVAGDGQQPTSTKAATAYREVRDQVELLTIRLEGLDAAYSDLNRQLIDAEPEVAAERHAFFEREVATFEPAFVQAATEFSAMLRKAAALGAGLDFTFNNLQNLNVPATLYRDSMKLYIAGVPRAWKDDPEATAIYESLVPRQELHEKIRREIAIVKSQGDEAAEVAARQRQNDHFKNGRQTVALNVLEHRDLAQEQADKDAEALMAAYERMLVDSGARQPQTTDPEAA